MQMIGRGLRGPAAGGTKEVFIVDFHDTWERFEFWMDPQKFDIFRNEPDEPNKETTPNTEEETELTGEVVHLPIDIILKLYRSLKSNVIEGTKTQVLPHGWYLVVNEKGEDKAILVYEDQLQGYSLLEKKKEQYVKSKISAENVISRYFDISDNLPIKEEMQLILNMISDTGLMPEYYTFEQCDNLDPLKIFEEMNRKFSKEEDKENWLKEIFDSTPLIKQIYKLFYIFKKTVFNAVTTKGSSLAFLDEKEDYHLVDNRFDLNEILNELITEYAFMDRKDLLEIRWSNNLVKGWLGLCQKIENENQGTQYTIIINILLSSTDVDRNIVKYLVYHEMLHKQGYWEHDDKFRELEWSFPDSEELDGFLDELTIRYHMDIIWKVKHS
jgi:hypothetical protein